MDGPMDQWTNGRRDQGMDGPTDGQFFFYTDAIDASESVDFLTDFESFTKALPTDRQTDQHTDGPTDRWTFLLKEMQKPHLKIE